MSYHRFVLILLDAALLVGLGLYTAAGLRQVPFHGDEATFVSMSRDYHILVYEGDVDALRFQRPLWRSERQYLRVMNGTINPYLIGAAWDLAGYTVRDLNDNWEWIEEPLGPWDQWGLNIRAGNKPTDDLLALARTPSTVLAALSIALVYAFARTLSGHRLAGWVAALIYATTPAILLNGRRAMQEGSLLFATTLLMLIALWVIREQEHTPIRWRRLAAGYLGLGAASGLAMATKHSAVVVVAAAFLVVAALPWIKARWSRQPLEPLFRWRHKYTLTAAILLAMLVAILLMPPWWYAAYALILAGFIALVLMVGYDVHGVSRWIGGGLIGLGMVGAAVVSPNWWIDFVTTTVTVVGARGRLVNVQVERVRADASMWDRVDMLVSEAFFAGSQYFEDPPWATYAPIQAEINAYEASHLDGRGGGIGWGLLLIGLAAGGVRWLWTQRKAGSTLLIAAWLLLVVLSLLANPLPWQRYYVVLHAPLATLIGLGACRVVAPDRARHWLARWWTWRL